MRSNGRRRFRFRPTLAILMAGIAGLALALALIRPYLLPEARAKRAADTFFLGLAGGSAWAGRYTIHVEDRQPERWRFRFQDSRTGALIAQVTFYDGEILQASLDDYPIGS